MDIFIFGLVGRVVALEVGIIQGQVIECFQLELLFALFVFLLWVVIIWCIPHTMSLFYHIIIKLQEIILSPSMIDSSSLLKRLRVSSTVNPLSQKSRLAQIKLAKLIYNNRHIRDIGRFLKEQQAILLKSREVPDERKSQVDQPAKKGRYDQNELKQLSYEFQSVRSKYVVQIDQKSKDFNTFNTQANQSKRRQSIRKKTNEMGKETNNRRPTNGHVSALPLNRLKSVSFSSHNTKQMSPRKEVLSPLRLRDRVNHNMEVQQVKISLKEQQLTSALNNLINLIGTKQSKNYVIPRQLIYEQIAKKYKLKVPEQEPATDFLMAILKASQQPENKYQVELPFCDFDNLKDSRKSIERIFNLPLKTAQRIAFKIYDRNDNGVIDEQDIVQLFTVAEQFSAMQQDMEIIVKNYKVNISTAQSTEGAARQISNSRFPKRFLTYADQSDFSIDKFNKFDIIQERTGTNQYQSSKFNKESFFTFKQTKKEFFKKKKSNQAAISLNWNDFQQAFKNTRPQIFYDILDFLFNINSIQIYEKANRLAYQQDKKSYRIMIFNNSDGKSEVGSNSNKVENQEQTSRRQQKQILAGKGRKTPKTHSKKPSNSTQRSQKTKNVEDLIDKVKLIDQFQSVKYN